MLARKSDHEGFAMQRVGKFVAYVGNFSAAAREMDETV
jgi:hypothetical protein